jgi:hypothetical protein
MKCRIAIASFVVLATALLQKVGMDRGVRCDAI